MKCCRLKRSGIVPTCDGWLWVLGFTLVGHGEEWADFVVARGLVRVDTGILVVNGNCFRQLSSIALALGHLVVAVAMPTATTIVDGAPTAHEAPGAPAATHSCEAPAEIAHMVGSAELSSPARGRRLQRCGVQGFLLPAFDLQLGVLRLNLIGHLQIETFIALLSVAFALGHLIVRPGTVASAPTVPAATTVVNGAPTVHEAPMVSAAAHPSEALAPIANVVGCAETVSPVGGRSL